MPVAYHRSGRSALVRRYLDSAAAWCLRRRGRTAMRSSFDKLISWTGVLFAALLLVAGGLLTWAYFFIGNEVESQLGIQGITMPEGEALESLPAADKAALEEYAGSPMDTGPEAKAYADHYILVHMNAASENRTYQEVSGEYQAMSDADKAS